MPACTPASLTRHPSKRLLVGVLVCVCCGGVAGVSTASEAHRARLSRDLADRLAARDERATDVIVNGSAETVNAIAARYGAHVKKRLQSGAVLEVTGGQLDAISQDPDVDHVAGDVPVRRMMAVTTVATGADQAWAGLSGLRGVTGQGISVAVIDSGIAPHADLRNHLVAAMDFVGTNGSAHDLFGHGTHVAGIVAGDDADGYSGMAPGANLVNLRVLEADGSGKTSDVIAAVDWAGAHQGQFNIRVIN